ncbi:MAG: ribonuclease HI family protein [Phycisphaerae bacterium]|nr:ribonuclease HI family protein [Phycisphaerae bacterium]
MNVFVNIDGGSRGNPGPAGAGVVIRAADDGTVLQQAGVFLGVATNNVAEYRGLIEGLRRAEALGAKRVEVASDSELLVRQMNGQYRVKNTGLKPLFEEANDLAGRFERFAIRHVPREENTLADEMANRAMNLKRTVEE